MVLLLLDNGKGEESKSTVERARKGERKQEGREKGRGVKAIKQSFLFFFFSFFFYFKFLGFGLEMNNNFPSVFCPGTEPKGSESPND